MFAFCLFINNNISCTISTLIKDLLIFKMIVNTKKSVTLVTFIKILVLPLILIFYYA